MLKGRKRRLSDIAGKSERSRMYQKVAKAQHLSHEGCHSVFRDCKLQGHQQEALAVTAQGGLNVSRSVSAFLQVPRTE